MRKKIKKYFIPHKNNGHRPHFFREEAVLTLLIVLVSSFAFSFVVTKIVRDSGMMATVYSGVLVDLTNESRNENELSTLTVNPLLTLAAKEKAKHMAENEYFAHTSPDGVTPWYWFGEVGYEFAYAGENLAIDFSESEDVEEAWMNSSGHRANILNQNFTEIGIATEKGMYKGHETVYVVQLFGAPLKPSFSQSFEEEEFEDNNQLVVQGGESSENSQSLVIREEESEVVEVLAVAEEVSEESVVVAVPSQNAEVLASVEVAPEVSGSERPLFQSTSKFDSSLEDEMLEITEETDTFIVVKNLSIENATSSPVFLTTSKGGMVKELPLKWYQKIALSPASVLQYFYAAFAVIVFVALLLMTFIEVRIQHPVNAAYGFLLLLIIGSLLYLNEFLVAPAVFAGL